MPQVILMLGVVGYEAETRLRRDHSSIKAPLTVDHEHLSGIRDQPAQYEPGGVLHLDLEVIAYPVDEALHNGAGNCVVSLHPMARCR